MTDEISRSPEESEKIGKRIADKLQAGDIVGFTGELGSGKTFIIRAICKTLGAKEIVTSPTFTLMHIYSGREQILHLDCFRIKSPQEAEMLGLDEYFNSHYICLIEWADKIVSLLPESTIHVALKHVPDKPTWRKISIDGL